MLDPRRTRAATLAGAALLVLLPFAASAQQPMPGSAADPSPGQPSERQVPERRGVPTKTDPDWPCVQRKVPTISAGAVWSGPPLDSAGDWGKDFEAASLAQTLASRRTPLSEMDGLIDNFAQTLGDDRKIRLTRVFAGVLELINTQRDKIIAGIARYARGQERMAERIRGESDKLSELKDQPTGPETKEVQDLETRLKWDTRIFTERRQSLSYVCETPVILEQRVFEIARKIQERL